MNNNILEFEKNMKANKAKLIIGILIIVFFLGINGILYLGIKEDMDNPEDFEKITEEGAYTCVEVEHMTDYFAEYTGGDDPDEKYYFIGNSDYYYIANLNQKNFEKLRHIYEYDYSEEEMEEPEKETICGNTNYILGDLKKYAIESFNELAGEEVIDNENFYSAFGMYYINTAETPMSNLLWGSIVINVFTIMGLIFVIIYFKDVKKTKKTLEKYSNEIDKIKMDVASPETIYEKKARIFLTRDYLINISSGLEIYNYEDILWIYPYEFRQNGIVTQKSIYLVDKDTKAQVISTLSPSKKNNIIFDELYENLALRTPQAMHGYSKENADNLKNMSKKKKL